MRATPENKPTARDRRRANNFDLLRLLAALAVLVSHSFALSGHPEPTIRGDHLGTVAVYVFFGISGYLITQSWVSSPKLRAFVVKRLLRIYPALIAVLLVGAFVMGPLLTTYSLHQYFGNFGTYRYVLDNLRMLSTYTVPGVPSPVVQDPTGVMFINGSIWTLPDEMRAYAVVAVLGVIGMFRSRLLVLAAWVAVIVIATRFPGNLFGPSDLLRTFAVGSLIYLFSDRLPLSLVAATALIVGWLALSRANMTDGQWLATTAIAYAAITVAHRSPVALRRLTSHGDFSYGIYLWAWPVQQTTLTLLPHPSSLMMICIALPVTAALAVCSWFLVERTALKLKPRPSAPIPEQGRDLRLAQARA